MHGMEKTMHEFLNLFAMKSSFNLVAHDLSDVTAYVCTGCVNVCLGGNICRSVYLDVNM